MEINIPEPRLKTQLLFDVTIERIMALYEQGCYQESLDICLQITHTHPEIVDAWIYAAVNCGRLGHWQNAAHYGETALIRGGNTLSLYCILAHAHGMLGQWDQARRHGLQALNIRARHFSVEPVIPLLEPGLLPPPPSAQTREHNIITFSLFGDDSKYCETAILNVQEQPQVYPHWICRFYVDDSVPASVINRLRKNGAQIVRVEGPALQWPGPIWRLLALDDPQAHRILFRDADCLISPREAAAVAQWVSSGKRFHMMRDNGACTELIQAGLWGVVNGSLPPLQELMQRFMSAPLKSKHFADQDFLRQYVWPYARASLMQHDSVFGFMDAAPFPDGDRAKGFFVGETEGLEVFTPSDLPDGSKVTWVLYRIIEKLDNNQARVELVCSYTNTVHNGVVKAHIPKRYQRWLQQGTAQMRLIGSKAA